MKIYKLPQLAELTHLGEYRLGPDDLNTQAVHLIYGRLRPKETARKISAAEGYEEIVCVIKGNLRVKYGKTIFMLSAGEAFHSKDAQTLVIDNMGDEEAVYISAGGRALKEANAAADKAGKASSAQTAPAEERIQDEAAEVESEFVITEDDSAEEETEEKDQ